MLSAVIQKEQEKTNQQLWAEHTPSRENRDYPRIKADGWFIGYNPRIVVGVRVGANNSRVHFQLYCTRPRPTWLFLSSACSCRNACKVTLTPIGPVCPFRFHRGCTKGSGSTYFQGKHKLVRKIDQPKTGKSKKKQDTGKDTDSPKKKVSSGKSGIYSRKR